MSHMTLQARFFRPDILLCQHPLSCFAGVLLFCAQVAGLASRYAPLRSRVKTVGDYQLYAGLPLKLADGGK